MAKSVIRQSHWSDSAEEDTCAVVAVPLKEMRFLRLKVMALAVMAVPSAWGGEGPFFITYTHQMEEPGNLEIATKNVIGKPGDGERFLGHSTELEYGVTGWWTSEWYLDGQVTSAVTA